MACIRFPADLAWSRKVLITRLGQPVWISGEVWPGQEEGLVVLALTPLEGSIHLVTNPEACISEHGPYHVSICQKSLYWFRLPYVHPSEPERPLCCFEYLCVHLSEVTELVITSMCPSVRGHCVG